MCSPRGRRRRCASSSNGPSRKSAFRSVGRARVSKKKAMTPNRARCLVEVDPRYFRPTEVDLLIGDPTKAQTKLGWKHDTSVQALCAEMVREDLKTVAEREHTAMPTDAIFPLAGKRVWVAGHNGMVGAAIIRRLAKENCEILTVDRISVDLKDQAATRDWIKSAKAGCHIPRGRESRRHSCQRYLSGGFSL